MCKEKFAQTSQTPDSPASAPTETSIKRLFKLGLQTPILDKMDIFQCIDFAVECGFQSLEIAAWPPLPEGQKPSRRYADVAQLRVLDVLDEKNGPAEIEKILAYSEEKGVEPASSLFCGNPLANPADAEWMLKVIQASAKLKIPVLTCFTGRVKDMNLEDSFQLLEKVFKPIVAEAERYDVKLAVEHCPMLFTETEMPYGCNLMSTPAIWERAFQLIPSDHFGICADISHFTWLSVDPIAPLYEFRTKIFSAHAKDIKVHRRKLERVGILAPPLDYMEPILPGFGGDVPWADYFDALYRIGFSGTVALEFEDKRFEPKKGEDDEITRRAILKAKRFLDQFVA